MTLMDAPATTPARLSRDEVTQAHEELRRALVGGSSDAALDYASTLARFAANERRVHGTFKRWSSNNLLLLEAQRRRRNLRHVGLYAGTRQWEKMGRAVRPDAVPMTIWVFSGREEDPAAQPAGQAAPTPPTPPQPTRRQRQAPQAAAPQNQAPQNPAPQPRHVFRGFIPREVFDYTDTAALDEDFVEPNWAVPLAIGDSATLERLVASSPVPVRFVDFGAHRENGTLNVAGIAIRDEMPIGNRISTLAHELAHHHLGHLEVLANAKRAEQDDKRAECEAEAGLAQWLVMKMLGLDESVGNEVTLAAADYLRSWLDPETGEAVDGHKRRERLLAARLERGLAAAERILDAFLELEHAPAT